MVRLSSGAAVLASIGKGHDIALVAYTLQSRPLLHALEDAARRGAEVRVRLEGSPYGDPDGSFASYNTRLATELRRSGADVHLNCPASGDAPLHAKALA